MFVALHEFWNLRSGRQRVSQIRPSGIGGINHCAGAVDAWAQQVPAGGLLTQLQDPRLVVAGIHHRGDSGIEHGVEVALIAKQIHADAVPAALQMDVHVREPRHHGLPFSVDDLRALRNLGGISWTRVFDFVALENHD